MTLIVPTAKKKWVFSSSQEKFKTMPMHNLVRGREGRGGGGSVGANKVCYGKNAQAHFSINIVYR